MRELQSLTQAVGRGALPDSAAAARVGAGAGATAASPSQAAAFTSQLQSQMLMNGMTSGDPAAAGAPQAGMGGLPVISAEQLMQQLQMQGSGVQALTQGAAPVAGPALAAGPSRLTGDTSGLNDTLRAALEQVAQQLGQPVEVKSGFRSRAEQAELYQRYLNGTGNLAAPPGSSNHESGNAADVYVNGVALANAPGGRAAATAAGLGFPVGGEPWHTETTG